MLRVFLRWSPNVNRLRRPGWFSDRRGVENALVAMKSAESTVTLVSDATPSGEIADLDWDGAVRLPAGTNPAGTNSESFLRALDLALDAALPGDKCGSEAQRGERGCRVARMPAYFCRGVPSAEWVRSGGRTS